MVIGQVSTVSIDWIKHVAIGLTKGIEDFDYWTNGWTPNEEVIDRLEVFYEGNMILAGEYNNADKCTHTVLFNNYNKLPNCLEAIGVLTGSNINDFEKILTQSFGLVPNELGNLYFKVDSITPTLATILKSNGVDINSIKIPPTIKSATDKKIDKKIRRIVYEK